MWGRATPRVRGLPVCALDPRWARPPPSRVDTTCDVVAPFPEGAEVPHLATPRGHGYTFLEDSS